MHYIEIIVIVVAGQALYFWSIFGYWTLLLTFRSEGRVETLKQKQKHAALALTLSFGLVFVFIVTVMFLNYLGVLE